MEIYLIRHGECHDSTQDYFSLEKDTMDPPLNPKGIEQANKLAERLKHIHFDRIYTSDLARALLTSKIINNSIKSEIIISENFREIDMGEIFLKSWNSYPEIYSKWLKHDEDIPYPNGENGNDVWERCYKELKEIILLNFNRIAIVCHGGTIRSMICGMLNIPQQKRFYFGIPPMNCSITVLNFDKNEYYLHTFNDYSHL